MQRVLCSISCDLDAKVKYCIINVSTPKPFYRCIGHVMQRFLCNILCNLGKKADICDGVPLTAVLLLLVFSFYI